MKNIRLGSTAIFILTIFAVTLAAPAFADRGRTRGHRRDNRWEEGRGRHFRDGRRSHDRYRNDRNYIFDRRHNHNRYYPRRGYFVKELPRNYRIFRHHRQRFYYHDGIWYRPGDFGFSVVLPPIGLTVPLLPPYYTTIWAGRTPYYYADGVYYLWRADEGAYVVSDPPPEDEVVADPPQTERLFIYPKSDQSEEQQAADRYECHRWAVDETGYDPTKLGGDVAAGEQPEKRVEYQRAMKACLEARDYSVR